MKTWLLLIAFYTPGGDYIYTSKNEFSSRQECEQVRQASVIQSWPMGQRVRAVCVDVTEYRQGGSK